MNLHVSTHKAVIGSKRRVIKAPVQQVVITCIEVPKEKKNKEGSSFPALLQPKENAEY